LCPGFTTRSAARIPVYCLLIGFDKEDAIRIAREIGTFEQSTSQASGCTAVPEGPSTKAKPDAIREIESMLEATGIPLPV
jgi:thiamine biosynthesis protein ThiI